MSESTAVDRYEDRTPVAFDERQQKSIEFEARTIFTLDNRLKKMKPDERKETAVALAITLHNLGLPVTVTNAKKLHLINGEPVESAQMLVGLLERNGHEVRVIEESDDRVVVRGWRHGTGEPHDVVYTVEQAKRSGALDEWVERWENQNGQNRLVEKLTIKVDDEPVNEPWPAWALKQIEWGRAKRKDAWFFYRSDMLVNRAVRRLAKRMGGDALLGVGTVDHDEPAERVTPPPPMRPTAEDPDDDDIADAELVEDGDREVVTPADDERPVEQAMFAPDDPARPFTED